MKKRVNRRGESGQAQVEAALTLPLTLFLIIGTIQLFMLLQARVLAEYAGFMAVRSGAVNHGDCRPMMHTAISTFLPAITRTDTVGKWKAAFNSQRRADKYDVRDAGGTYNGPIVEMVRVTPNQGFLGVLPEDYSFDQPSSSPTTLSVRMVFWYELRVPFANWVIAHMLLASMGVNYTAQNPLMEAQKANWTSTQAGNQAKGFLDAESWPSGTLSTTLQTAVNAGHYLVPIEVGAAMRMMTPLKNVGAFTSCPSFQVAP